MNSLNLKKKIAFISSLAMLAATAAYLPADIAKQVGFGSSIVEAAGSYETKGTLETLDLYVTVDGKYLANDDKLYGSLEDIPGTQAAVTLTSSVDTDSNNLNSAPDATEYIDKYVVSTGSGATIKLPYDIVKGGSKIAVVAAVKENAAAALISGTKSVEVALDEHGLATVPKQSSYIIGQSDDSNYQDGEAAKGGYEVVDLSGLKFQIEDAADLTDLAPNAITEPAVPAVVATDAVKSEYQYTKVGDIYARNITISTVNVVPNGSVKVKLAPATNWTVTGTGVSDGVLSLTMGDDNKAQSGLITYAKGDQKEYYIVNIDNSVPELTSSNIAIADVAGGGVAVFASPESVEEEASYTGAYKIVQTKKAMQTADGKKFVNVYTVYTNNADKTGHTYTLTAENNYSSFANSEKRIVISQAQNTGTTGLATLEIGDAADTSTSAQTVKFESKDGASCATPIMKAVGQKGDGSNKWVADAGVKDVYFQIVVTNEYELEFDTDVDDENGKDITVKTQVKGQTITRPEDPKKPGYTFSAWLNKSDSSKQVFVAGNSVQQTGTEITPNVEIVADYTANSYTANFDANGGEWGSTPTGFVTSGVNDDKKAVVISKDTNSGSDVSSDFTLGATAGVANNNGSGASALKRKGYTLLGWSNVKNAEKPLTEEEFAKIRPDVNNGSLTLYAVWEAKDVTINFEYIGFNINGTSKTGTALGDYTSGQTLQVEDGNGGTTNEPTNFEVKTDANLGKLPTPVLKGYTFDGWYKQVKTSDTTYTAVKVSSLSKLTQEMLSDDTHATLYAKFKQNTYKITYDLDGGEFNKEDKPATTFKYVAAADASTNTISLFDEDGKAASDVSPAKGSGYFEFDGWTVTSGDKSETLSKTQSLDETSFASDITVKPVWTVQSSNKNNSSIAINANGGDIYTIGSCEGEDNDSEGNSGYGYCDTHTAVTAGPHKVYSSPASLTGAIGQPGAEVSTAATIDSENFSITSGSNLGDYVVARAGYTFTGWYADKECTVPYSFTKFPEKGTEVTAYAGWKADPSTRYNMKYTLIDADGAIYEQGTKTYMDTTGNEVSAIEKTITVKSGSTSTKYVFDAKLSTGKNITDTVNAEFNATSLTAGKFENDPAKYTVLEAVFVDESIATTTLGTVNDTIVDTNGKVTWSPVDNAVAYKVVKKVGDKTYYSDKITATEYKFGSVPETAYSVRVVAFDKDGNKTWGKEVTVAAPVDPYAIGEIKNVKVDADRKTVTWDKVDNAVTYKLVKKIGDKTYYTSEIADTSYTFATATQGAFTVNVVAINVNGDRKWSDDVKVEAVKSNLGAAGNVKVGTDNKTLTWSAVDNAVSYRVAKIVGGKTYYTAKTTKLTTTLGSALKEGNKVYLIAYDKNGKSVTGPQTKISSVAKATKVAVAADGKTVTWTAAKNAAKYQVAKLINGKTYYGTKVDAKTTKYTFGSAATAGTQVFVITFDADGNSSYSDAVLVK